MSLKQLIKPFGYTELVAECAKQHWRLPTVDDLKGLDPDDGYELVWIDHKPHTDERLHYAYNIVSGGIFEVNKRFKLHTYVVKLTDEEVCAKCVHKTDVYNLECCDCSRYYPDKFEEK